MYCEESSSSFISAEPLAGLGRMTCGPPCEAGNKNACSGDLPSPPGRRVKTRKRDCRWLVSRLVRHKNPYTALRDGYRCGPGEKKVKIFRFFSSSPIELYFFTFTVDDKKNYDFPLSIPGAVLLFCFLPRLLFWLPLYYTKN